MIYLFNYLIIPIYYNLIKARSSSKIKTRQAFFFIVSLHSILFRALSNPFNYVDTEVYADNFRLIREMSFREAVLSLNVHSAWGQGYVALNWLIGQYTPNPIFLFFIISILSVGGVMIFYYRTTYTPLNTTMLYLLYPMMYIMGFGVLRQHLSIMFILLALYNIDRLKYSIPLVTIGVLCHTASLVFLPFFMIRNISINKISIGKVLFLAIAGFVFLNLSIQYLLSYSERYLAVFEKGGNESNIVPVVIIGSMIIMFFSTGILGKIKDSHDKHVVNFIFYGLIIALFGTTVPSAGRLTLMFIYVIPVAISLLYRYCDDKKKIFVNIYSLSLYSLTVLMIIMSYMSSGKYFDYSFFWD